MTSAIVLTHNNGKSIASCLESLSWCDEILVIDDESSDDTAEIAKKNQASVFSRPLQYNFAAQRNFGLEKAKGDWVFFVDSDEIVTKKSAHEIQQKIKRTDKKGFYLRRIDVLFGTQLQFGETSNVSLLRLARKDAGEWKRSVHEVWDVKGKTEKLEHPLLHYPHPTMTEFITDINTYSTLHAEEFFREGKKVTALEIIAFPAGKFLRNYILRQGFRDGTVGAIMAVMMSFHSFLARGKLFLMWEKDSRV